MEASDVMGVLLRGVRMADRYRILKRQHAARLAKRDLSRFPLARRRIARELETPTSRWFTEDSLVAAMEACRNRGIEVAANENQLMVSWDTPPIELSEDDESLELGVMSVVIYYDWRDDSIVGTARPHTPLRHAIHGYFHPHISDGGGICLGMSGKLMAAAIKDGQFDAVADIGDEMLQTYNDESAYVSLSTWFGYECASCGDHIGDRYTCDDCGRVTCEDCCVYDDGRYCPGCCDECCGCGDFKKNLITVPCCKKQFCRGCLDVE